MIKTALQERTYITVAVIVITLIHVYYTLRGSRHSSINSSRNSLEWPVSGLRVVALTPEESIHYRIETDIGAAEWESSLPRGRGVVFHGQSPNVKAYRLAMFHQLSCLSTVRKSLANPTIPPIPETHFCLNYIRESLACGADSHLEMVRSEYGGRAVLPYTTRTDCLDWERVWEVAESSFDEWARSK